MPAGLMISALSASAGVVQLNTVLCFSVANNFKTTKKFVEQQATGDIIRRERHAYQSEQWTQFTKRHRAMSTWVYSGRVIEFTSPTHTRGEW